MGAHPFPPPSTCFIWIFAVVIAGVRCVLTVVYFIVLSCIDARQLLSTWIPIAHVLADIDVL